MQPRREFLKKSGLAAMAGLAPGWTNAAAALTGEITHLTILHTNDLHSRIDPFPQDGSRNAGLGGAAVRAAMIKQYRAEHDNVLLLDAGDVFQGTPYFNFYLGEIDIRLMREMGYDAVTMGNHDFDGGIDNYEKQIREQGNFPVVIANYDMRDTSMAGRYVPRHIIQKGKVRIGITGVGIDIDGLVPKALTGSTRYLDPISAATAQAEILRHDEKCDFVICLSHLGYKYDREKVSDIHLAQQSRDIDLIIGGHTHTFMDAPDYRRNGDGKNVMIHQVGWAGLRLGKIDIAFEENRRNKCVSCEGIWVRS